MAVATDKTPPPGVFDDDPFVDVAPPPVPPSPVVLRREDPSPVPPSPEDPSPVALTLERALEYLENICHDLACEECGDSPIFPSYQLDAVDYIVKDIDRYDMAEFYDAADKCRLVMCLFTIIGNAFVKEWHPEGDPIIEWLLSSAWHLLTYKKILLSLRQNMMMLGPWPRPARVPQKGKVYPNKVRKCACKPKDLAAGSECNCLAAALVREEAEEKQKKEEIEKLVTVREQVNACLSNARLSKVPERKKAAEDILKFLETW